MRRKIKIHQEVSGYELFIDEWFIDIYKSIGELLEYLNSRITSDFN